MKNTWLVPGDMVHHDIFFAEEVLLVISVTDELDEIEKVDKKNRSFTWMHVRLFCPSNEKKIIDINVLVDEKKSHWKKIVT